MHTRDGDRNIITTTVVIIGEAQKSLLLQQPSHSALIVTGFGEALLHLDFVKCFVS